MRWTGVVICLVVAAAALATPARAQVDRVIDPRTEPIAAFVADIDKGLRAAHEQAQGNAEKLRDGCRDVLVRALDLDAMAHATTEKAWNRMNETQRETYRVAFSEKLAVDCVKQMASHVGVPAQIAGVRTASDGDKLAAVRIGPPDDTKIVTWRLRRGDAGKWSAVDIIWEGRSAVAAARDEFAAVLQGAGGDIDAVLGRMRK